MERMFQSFEGKFRTLLLEKTFHSLQALLKKKKLELSQKKKKNFAKHNFVFIIKIN